MNTFNALSIDEIVRYGIAVIIIIAGLMGVIYTIWWGFLMILSAGNEEKVKVAINHIRHAFIGLAFLILVLFISPFISRFLGITYGEYLAPETVFGTIREISQKIFWAHVYPDDSGVNTPVDVQSSNFSDL